MKKPFFLLFSFFLFAGCSNLSSPSNSEENVAKPDVENVSEKEIFYESELKNIVFAEIDKKTKGVWDKKLETRSLHPSQKAVRGVWWAKDAWNWISWLENGTWTVLVSLDGFDCAEIDNIPTEYADFFHDDIYTSGGDNKYCYDHNSKNETPSSL